jgi:hypothetical protein
MRRLLKQNQFMKNTHRTIPQSEKPSWEPDPEPELSKFGDFMTVGTKRNAPTSGGCWGKCPADIAWGLLVSGGQRQRNNPSQRELRALPLSYSLAQKADA